MLDVILILALTIFSVFITFLTLIIKKGKQTLKVAPDYLLILGCKVNRDLPSRTLQSRIDFAKDYLIKNPNVIAFCCGGIVQKDQIKSEAKVIYDSLIKSGIDKNRLILEDKSTTTVENFLNVKQLLSQMGEKDCSIAFTTSDFHVFRSELIAKNANLKCKGIGVKSPNNKKIKHYLREVIILPYFFKQSKENLRCQKY